MKIIKSFRNVFYILKMVYSISKTRVILSIVNEILRQSYGVFMSIMFVKIITNALISASGFGEIIFILLGVLILSGIFLLYLYLYNDYYKVKIDIKIVANIQKSIYEKAASVDLFCYDNPKYYDTYIKATENLSDLSLGTIDVLGNLIGRLFSFITAAILIIQMNVFALTFILIPTLLIPFFRKKQNKLNYQKKNDITPYNKQLIYVNRTTFNIFKYLPIFYVIYAASHGAMNWGDTPALLAAISSFSFRSNGITNGYNNLLQK